MKISIYRQSENIIYPISFLRREYRRMIYMVSMEKIKGIASIIAEHIKPEKIILFVKMGRCQILHYSLQSMNYS